MNARFQNLNQSELLQTPIDRRIVQTWLNVCRICAYQSIKFQLPHDSDDFPAYGGAQMMVPHFKNTNTKDR